MCCWLLDNIQNSEKSFHTVLASSAAIHVWRHRTTVHIYLISRCRTWEIMLIRQMVIDHCSVCRMNMVYYVLTTCMHNITFSGMYYCLFRYSAPHPWPIMSHSITSFIHLSLLAYVMSGGMSEAVTYFFDILFYFFLYQ